MDTCKFAQVVILPSAPPLPWLLQILELVVSPVVGSMGRADVLNDCAVLDVHRAAGNQLGVLGLSQEATYR